MWIFVLHVEILAIVFLHSLSGSSRFYKLFIMTKVCYDWLPHNSAASLLPRGEGAAIKQQRFISITVVSYVYSDSE